MNLKQKKYGNQVWECESTEDLMRVCVSHETDNAVRELSEIIARMLDAMPLTDQQKLDIIEPYSKWEIVKEAK